MKIVGDLVLTEDYHIDEDLTVEGNIRCEGGLWNLTCDDLTCDDLNCCDLKCCDLKCCDLKCCVLNCYDLKCCDLNCWNLKCENLNFYGVAIVYNSMECRSWKARRDNYIIKCLDGEIKVEDDV
jgi:hypothetical protein